MSGDIIVGNKNMHMIPINEYTNGSRYWRRIKFQKGPEVALMGIQCQLYPVF